MERTLHLIEQFTDIVERNAVSRSEVARGDHKSRARFLRLLGRKPSPNEVVERVLERTPGTSGFGRNLRRNIIVQGGSRSHDAFDAISEHHRNQRRYTFL